QRSATNVTFPLVWLNLLCTIAAKINYKGDIPFGVINATQRKLLDKLCIPSIDLLVNEFISLGRIL
ncbi:isopentenyl diphosphate isomerase, partial [Tanacetum coccineum]